MRRFLKNGLAVLAVFALGGMLLASNPQFGQNKGSGPGFPPKAGRPVQQPVKPKSPPPPTVPGGHGTTQPKPKPPTVLLPGHGPATTKPGNPGHDTTGTKPSLGGKNVTTPSSAASKKDGTIRRDPSDSSGTTINNINNINNNNDNIRINIGDFGWGGWAAWTGPVTWGGFGWSGWGLPAYLPFALWSPIHEPIVFLP